MTTSNHAPHSGAPYGLPAVLLYGLDEAASYSLRVIRGEWVLSELVLDAPAGGGLRVSAGTPVVPHPAVRVDAGADLRHAPAGAATTVTKLDEAQS